MELLNEGGDIINKWETPTNKKDNGIYIVDDIWNSITNNLAKLPIEKNKILGIDVGAPGFVNEKTGMVYEAVNIGWENFELADLLKDRSGLPVFVENDANLAVLGENWKGAGNQERDIIAVTLGTGVGGGIIANGVILNGFNGTAGEVGHIIVDPNGYPCNCGRIGCLDTVASATGIVHQALDKIEEDPTSTLANYYYRNGNIDAKDIFYLASKGDVTCKNKINRTADVLGLIIANTATIINPTKVLIGGGLSKAGDQVLHLITKYFQKYSLTRISDVCEVKIAQLGNEAGVIGAAYLVKQKLQNL
ncbi:ROK family glucokinase [Virgibacillus necropolis]|uniref:ROK family glucokinase n=1 Tax=Virgibacillus necropolis TaxID=163877 RepID=UPI0026A57534|nr:ROK family glucokinase [Virgibacillus necropolis]